MPSVQTSYPGTQARAYEGMQGTMSPPDIASRIVETSGGIGFGKAAFQGATEQGIVATGSIFVGVTLADKMARPNAAGTDVLAKGETAAVMRKGDVWVTVSGAVTLQAPAYVTSAGLFSASPTNNTAIPAVFETAAADGALALLKLNLP
ncbi:MAG: hypothetical protein K2X71_17275 [Methylobacterium sp.]|uniref:structural cement protein Gp24 n=1 Tax=Methylobacterium sp. TaxID=409 RepID=UPI0025876A79|nr:hypothetical protein [Methylobacterium sp.]MBY0297757.1 hypothetical protein [Methylobacterium sp.]